MSSTTSSLFFVAALTLCLVANAAPIPVSQLGGLIQQVISQPQYDRMEWGILIESRLSNGSYSTLYSLNADQFFVPASNNKVLTTVPTYLYFGDKFRFRTSFIGSNNTAPVDNACLLGRGDPTMSVYQLETLANSVASQGINSIKTVTIDDTYFPTFPQAWEWEDLIADYGAQPNSLILSQNQITIKVSPGANYGPVSYSFNSTVDHYCNCVVNQAVTVPIGTPITDPLQSTYPIGESCIHLTGQMLANQAPVSFTSSVIQPAKRFVCTLKYYFTAANITVGTYKLGKCLPDNSWSEIDAIFSQFSMDQIMNYTLQQSDNLNTECFLRTLGAVYGAGVNNAENEGKALVKQILNQLGVNVTAFVQDDGSGLSRHNLVSPRALAQTLELMDNTPSGPTYRTFLPVAGESGSLAGRFIGEPAQGIVQAKTGTVSGVSALSGYVNQTSTFSQIVFSIIGNFSDQSATVIREGIDDIVNILAQLTN